MGNKRLLKKIFWARSSYGLDGIKCQLNTALYHISHHTPYHIGLNGEQVFRVQITVEPLATVKRREANNRWQKLPSWVIPGALIEMKNCVYKVDLITTNFSDGRWAICCHLLSDPSQTMTFFREKGKRHWKQTFLKDNGS
jgi:hypothetical protein